MQSRNVLCVFYAVFETGVQTPLYFYGRGASFKKVWESMSYDVKWRN